MGTKVQVLESFDQSEVSCRASTSTGTRWFASSGSVSWSPAQGTAGLEDQMEMSEEKEEELHFSFLVCKRGAPASPSPCSTTITRRRCLLILGQWSIWATDCFQDFACARELAFLAFCFTTTRLLFLAHKEVSISVQRSHWLAGQQQQAVVISLVWLAYARTAGPSAQPAVFLGRREWT